MAVVLFFNPKDYKHFEKAEKHFNLKKFLKLTIPLLLIAILCLALIFLGTLPKPAQLEPLYRSMKFTGAYQEVTNSENLLYLDITTNVTGETSWKEIWKIDGRQLEFGFDDPLPGKFVGNKWVEISADRGIVTCTTQFYSVGKLKRTCWVDEELVEELSGTYKNMFL